MDTSSGDRPSPATWVLKPTLALTLYVPGLNSRALRWVPNWLDCWVLKTESRVLWIVALDIVGSKIETLGPKLGVSEVGGAEVVLLGDAEAEAEADEPPVV